MKSTRRAILRIVDANLNRLSEGLRVVEDILRFGRDSAKLSAEARRIRHLFGKAADAFVPRRQLISSRRSTTDVGARRWRARRRASVGDVKTANLRRAQESGRVLEECARLVGGAAATRAFQRLRYRTYELEAAIARRGR